MVLLGSSPITDPSHLLKHARSQGPLLRRHYPASSCRRHAPHVRSYDPVRLPPEPPPKANVEAATLVHDGSPPITRITFPTCRAHYPGGSSGCLCRLLPRSCSLPQMAGGSASALTLSRPAQASHALRPAGSLSHPRRPLSWGFNPAGYPTKPPTSYRINQQLSRWNLPPLVIRAFGAHCQQRPSGVANIVPINLVMGVSYADAELYPISRPTSRKPLERRQIRGRSPGDYTNKLQSWKMETNMPASLRQSNPSGIFRLGHVDKLLSDIRVAMM